MSVVSIRDASLWLLLCLDGYYNIFLFPNQIYMYIYIFGRKKLVPFLRAFPTLDVLFLKSIPSPSHHRNLSFRCMARPYTSDHGLPVSLRMSRLLLSMFILAHLLLYKSHSYVYTVCACARLGKSSPRTFTRSRSSMVASVRCQGVEEIDMPRDRSLSQPNHRA